MASEADPHHHIRTLGGPVEALALSRPVSTRRRWLPLLAARGVSEGQGSGVSQRKGLDTAYFMSQPIANSRTTHASRQVTLAGQAFPYNPACHERTRHSLHRLVAYLATVFVPAVLFCLGTASSPTPTQCSVVIAEFHAQSRRLHLRRLRLHVHVPAPLLARGEPCLVSFLWPSRVPRPRRSIMCDGRLSAVRRAGALT